MQFQNVSLARKRFMQIFTFLLLFISFQTMAAISLECEADTFVREGVTNPHDFGTSSTFHAGYTCPLPIKNDWTDCFMLCMIAA